MVNDNHAIKKEWYPYYEELEKIRKSGITNMWGASPYLAKNCNIGHELAVDILLNWISNYNQLNEIFGWQIESSDSSAVTDDETKAFLDELHSEQIEQMG